ncbi:MAG: response regulator [Alphaproteobacteria bacterium]|nr:response regulator [Alphaproteobacteria bacterium]
MPSIVKDSRILIVDDSLIIRAMMRNLLSEMGYSSFEEAENGLVAWEKLQKAKSENMLFRIMILDWSMPGMNGLALLEKCREDRGLDSMAIVMLTAISEISDMMLAIKKGATAYVTKPFEPQKVAEAIKQISAWAETIGHT